MHCLFILSGLTALVSAAYLPVSKSTSWPLVDDAISTTSPPYALPIPAITVPGGPDCPEVVVFQPGPVVIVEPETVGDVITANELSRPEHGADDVDSEEEDEDAEGQGDEN